jgi:hypothetical protein
MSDESTPRSPLDPENVTLDNRKAINKIRSLAPDLWAIQEHEQRILDGKNDLPWKAEPADESKSD